LIIPIVIAASLSATPVKDTVWWDTAGGRVTQHRDETGTNCSLMLYNDEGSVIFEWVDPGTTSVTAVDWNWQFPSDWRLPVAVQLGDVWLSNGGDSAIIQAVGHGNAVTFAVNQPIDDLLGPADHVQIRTKNGELSIKLNQAKTGTLLSHARQCRELVRR
jgi:hypothetical protein